MGGGRQPAAYRPIETRPAAGLDYREFVRDYVEAKRPLVISGAASAWPAVGKWTPEFFKERFPQKLVQVSYEQRMTFAELVDGVLASTDEKPGPYLHRLFLHEHLPEVLEDLSPPNPYAFPRWYASPLMREYWRRPDGYLKLLFGGTGGKFPVMHYDGENAHATITQIYGDKEFVIYAPEDGARLYPSPARANHSLVDDPVNQDLTRFPLLGGASQFRAVLKPGDMVFVPCQWWHSARALTPSISVGMNLLDSSNWDGFVREISGPATLSPRWFLKRAYWSAARLTLGSMEALQRRSPALARALRIPLNLAPDSPDVAPDPSKTPLHIRVPTS